MLGICYFFQCLRQPFDSEQWLYSVLRLGDDMRRIETCSVQFLFSLFALAFLLGVFMCFGSSSSLLARLVLSHLTAMTWNSRRASGKIGWVSIGSDIHLLSCLHQAAFFSIGAGSCSSDLLPLSWAFGILGMGIAFLPSFLFPRETHNKSIYCKGRDRTE